MLGRCYDLDLYESIIENRYEISDITTFSKDL